MALAAAVLVMLLAAPFALANAQTTVDWTLGKDYSSYSTQSFKPADTIVFNYDKTLHNVEVVSKSDYDNCNLGNAIQTFTDGKTTITLKQGPMYFICGIPGHCQAGMKLQVNVADSGSSKPATPATPATPSSVPFPEPALAPAGFGLNSPLSAPAPKDGSSGAAGLSSGSHLMFVMALVSGAVFAFMA